MLNSENIRYTSTLRIKPRYSLFQVFNIDKPSKTIDNLTENGSKQNNVIHQKLQDYVDSDENTLINKNYTNDEIEEMKQHENEMTRIKNEILFIKCEIESIEYYNKLNQYGIEPTNRTEKLEVLYNELTKRKIKLIEHLKEINKRRVEFDKHRDKTKKEEEEKYIYNEKQRRTDTIERHKKYDSVIMRRFKEPIKHDIKLLEQQTERIRGEIRLLKNGFESMKYLYPLSVKNPKERFDHGSKLNILNWDEMVQQHEQLKRSNKSKSIPDIQQTVRSEQFHSNPVIHKDNDILIDQAKYDIILSYANQNIRTIEIIKNALLKWFSVQVKDNYSSENIKICLDNTSTAVIAIINNEYELSATCQADMIHIFKSQFPLVLVISERDFKPSSNWLNLIWNTSNTQKVFLDFPDFEENLRSAITDAPWNLSPNLKNSKMILSTSNNRSRRFLGNLNEWTIAFRNPTHVSHKYRQLINDPLRIATDTKLQNIYYNYIRIYFQNSDLIKLFDRGVNENDMCKFIQAYTYTDSFSATLNRHIAANIFFYFGSTLHDNVDYQLIKSLIDFVALCIYRQELHSYLFNGIVYRSVVMSEADLLNFVFGSRIMNTTFLSTSKDKQVVELFSKQNQQEFVVLCTYVINNKNKRRTALDIEYLSCFPDEREVLILPFSPFYVKNVTRSSDRSKAVEIMLVEDDFDTFGSKDAMLLTIRI